MLIFFGVRSLLRDCFRIWNQIPTLNYRALQMCGALVCWAIAADGENRFSDPPRLVEIGLKAKK
jgi:hypothetical protein